MWLGLEAGPRANFAKYRLTDIYFFYLSLKVGPYTEFYFKQAKRWLLRIALPVNVQFRLDTDTDVGLGVGVSLRYRPSFSR
jgi:hypothetical protein